MHSQYSIGIEKLRNQDGDQMRSTPMLRDQPPDGAVNTVIARESVFSQVHRYIRDKILRGGYPEGTRLIETSIAAELNISRTPVREALVLLAGQDLVTTPEGGGFVVSNVREQLLDILDIRVALESHAVARAAGDISSTEIESLEQLCTEMEALPSEQVDLRADMNRKFHEMLIGAAHNRRLAKMVGEYQDYFRIAQPLFDPAAVQRTQAEHRGIVNALRDHDTELASRLVAGHIRNAGAHIMSQLDKNRKAQKVTFSTPGKT